MLNDDVQEDPRNIPTAMRFTSYILHTDPVWVSSHTDDTSSSANGAHEFSVLIFFLKIMFLVIDTSLMKT